MTSKILTIVGARPQFIKASVVSLALREAGLNEEILHTGQHFDRNMSDVFFSQLGIPQPKHVLNINGGSHGQMTGRMLEQIEDILLLVKPGLVLVFGDTNSTLAGALSAAKLHIPIAHVEAGLRSFDRSMPEEINRVLTDNLSSVLFCPTSAAVENLHNEGIVPTDAIRVETIGDVMEDSLKLFSSRKSCPANVDPNKDFVLATIHRAENTDDIGRLTQIVDGLNRLNETVDVILPIHPRTSQRIKQAGLAFNGQQIDPIGYLEMLWLLDRCGLVVTDSGGLQKEAFFSGKQCITLRDNTEWVELVDVGANVLVGANADKLIEEAAKRFDQETFNDGSLYGGGTASLRIAQALL